MKEDNSEFAKYLEDDDDMHHNMAGYKPVVQGLAHGYDQNISREAHLARERYHDATNLEMMSTENRYHQQNPEMITYKRQEENTQPKFMKMLKSFIVGGEVSKPKVSTQQNYRATEQQHYPATEQLQHYPATAQQQQQYPATEQQQHYPATAQQHYPAPKQQHYPATAQQMEFIDDQNIHMSRHDQYIEEGVQQPRIRQRTLSESSVHEMRRVRQPIRKSPWNVIQSFFGPDKTRIRSEYTEREPRAQHLVHSLPPNYSNIAAVRYSSTSSPFQQNQFENPNGVQGYTGRHTYGGRFMQTLRSFDQPLHHNHQPYYQQERPEIIRSQPNFIANQPPPIHQPYFQQERQDIRNQPNFVLESLTPKVPEVLKIHADYHPGNNRDTGTGALQSSMVVGQEMMTSSMNHHAEMAPLIDHHHQQQHHHQQHHQQHHRDNKKKSNHHKKQKHQQNYHHHQPNHHDPHHHEPHHHQQHHHQSNHHDQHHQHHHEYHPHEFRQVDNVNNAIPNEPLPYNNKLVINTRM